MGRQRPADRAPGAELLRRAVRSDAAVRSGLPAAGRASQTTRLDFAAELRRALREADGRGRKGVRTAVEVPGTLGRLVDDLRDDRQARAADLAAGVPARARARAGVPGRSADALGRRFQDSRP